MEVCGGHTHTIYRHGIKDLLPEQVELVHGPGCPVCVLPMGRVDEGIEIAERPEVIFTCFGDMMRVPGSKGNLLEVKAQGADIRSEEHTSELQSRQYLVCRLLLEKKE